MSELLSTRISGATLEAFLGSLGTVHKALPREISQQLKDVFVNYLTKYGGEGAYKRMNGRTVAQIFAEFQPAILHPVASGEVNGVQYKLYVPEETDDARHNKDE